MEFKKVLKKKRWLSNSEIKEAQNLLKLGKSIGQLARYFECNKPSIKKSLGLY